MRCRPDDPLNIAVIGTGIAGMSAAWLLSEAHRVTVYEQDDRPGGHSHTVDVATGDGTMPVDTGFIVYNEAAYPNLTALFAHLGVATKPSVMSFAVSLHGGRLEYSGTDFNGLFAQRKNLLSPRFWSMLRDLVRFYREAPAVQDSLGVESLGAFLARGNYGAPFRDDHLLPMAAAIWSAPPALLLDYPARSFIRFFENHGLFKIAGRPAWRTVVGGSREYVRRLTRRHADRIRLANGVETLIRTPDGVRVVDASGEATLFDHVVVATHADQALAMIDAPTPEESRVLGAFRYGRNHAVLHRDTALMPRRRAAWSSWNYLESRGASASLCVTYWMNELQGLADPTPLFVTLNPCRAPRPEAILREMTYDHPIFDVPALGAQQRLWSLQGQQRLWFCGSYFGAGFHEDALQAGLAVAEQLGGVRRPWAVADESARICLTPASTPRPDILAAAS
jgi:predicted NAD/FAD-binding protein